MLKAEISVVFKLGIKMIYLYHMIELGSLKNLCSINFSLKGLVWPVQLREVWWFLVSLAFWPKRADFAWLYWPKESFLRRVYLTKVVQGIEIYKRSLILHLYYRFEYFETLKADWWPVINFVNLSIYTSIWKVFCWTIMGDICQIGYIKWWNIRRILVRKKS